MTTTRIIGNLRWIPAAENGPNIPFQLTKMSAFAYVEPNVDVEGAVLIRGLTGDGDDSRAELSWVPGYPMPETGPGDVITVLAAQRPIATIIVTDTVATDADVPAKH